jgi:hypothetical protein
MQSLFLYWSEQESSTIRDICQSQVNNLSLSNANKYIQYHVIYITKFHYYLSIPLLFQFLFFPLQSEQLYCRLMDQQKAA